MAEAMQASTPVLQKWMSEQMTEVQRSAEEFCKGMRNEKQKSEAPKQKSS